MNYQAYMAGSPLARGPHGHSGGERLSAAPIDQGDSRIIVCRDCHPVAMVQKRGERLPAWVTQTLQGIMIPNFVFRLDYSDLDTKNRNAWINIYKGSNGEMQLEKQAFGSWPA